MSPNNLLGISFLKLMKTVLLVLAIFTVASNYSLVQQAETLGQKVFAYSFITLFAVLFSSITYIIMIVVQFFVINYVIREKEMMIVANQTTPFVIYPKPQKSKTSSFLPFLVFILSTALFYVAGLKTFFDDVNLSVYHLILVASCVGLQPVLSSYAIEADEYNDILSEINKT